VAKPEWGNKRSCPKCGTRFYDLGKTAPVVCIDCAHEWKPEPILKSKQPVAEAVEKSVKTEQKSAPAEEVVEAADLEVGEEAAETDDVDVDVDDDNDDTDVAEVVTPPLDEDED